MAEPRKVAVCGGGNAAHVMAALLPSILPNTAVHILTVFGDEADRWNRKLEETGKMSLVLTHEDESKTTVESMPALVTKDPAAAVTGADVVFLPLPAFAHEGYLRAIAPHLAADAAVVGMPSYPGFLWLTQQAIAATGGPSTVHVLGTDTLPWAARLTEYGSSAEVLGTKKQILLCGGDEATHRKLQACFGPAPKLRRVSGLTVDLGGPNPIAHAAIMYGRWYNWDGVPRADKPIFYNAVDAFSVDIMEAMNAEVLATRDAVAVLRPELDLGDVMSMRDFLLMAYPTQMADTSTLRTCFLTNSAHKGLQHPMRETGDGNFVPDFGYRYFTEDLPMGLVPLRGIAQLAGVATPTMDRVILWMQDKMGKEYLKDGDLCGKDIGETRAPIRFGITSIDQLIW